MGKTDRCLITRLRENGTRSDQPMFQHLSQCIAFQDQCNLFALPDPYSPISTMNSSFDFN